MLMPDAATKRPRLWAALLPLAASGALAFAATAGAAQSSGQSAYGGLGAPVRVFYAQNPTGSGFPPPGIAFYYVDRLVKGRVAAFHIVINVEPQFSARELVATISGIIERPADAEMTNLNRSSCIVWRSRTLKKLIGMEYAVATTGLDHTTASFAASSTPHC